MKNSFIKEQGFIKSNYDILTITIVSIVFVLLAAFSLDNIYLLGTPLLLTTFIFTYIPFRKLRKGDERIKLLTYETSFAAFTIFISITVIACIWLNFNYHTQYTFTLSVDSIIKNVFLGLGILSVTFSALFAFFKRKH